MEGSDFCTLTLTLTYPWTIPSGFCKPLTISNYNKPFFLATDASSYGVGAVLSQEGEINPRTLKIMRHPIAYYSATFTETERNYDIFERELLNSIRKESQSQTLLLQPPDRYEIKGLFDFHCLKWSSQGIPVNSQYYALTPLLGYCVVMCTCLSTFSVCFPLQCMFFLFVSDFFVCFFS
jgi:hypothetical protein